MRFHWLAPSLPLLLAACSGGSPAQVPDDVRSLYRMEVGAEPSELPAGQGGVLRIAVRPTVKGAHVKPETPFDGKLTATGPVELARQAIGFEDNARIEKGGPVFEIPWTAKAPGAGALQADLTFFVCTDTACLRTTEELEVPVRVTAAE